MKLRNFIFTFLFLLFTSANSFAQQAQKYTTIYLWLGYDFPKNVEVQLVMNNQRISTFKSRELLEYKIYSKGKVTFEIFMRGYSTITHQEQILLGHSYYYEMKLKGSSTSFLKLLDNSDGEDIIYNHRYFNNRYSFEEDIRQPLVPGSIAQAFTSSRTGSGFLLSKDGYIVTNHHVIDNAAKITIKGVNGDYTTAYTAKIVADDKNNDLTILQLENKAINFGDVPFTIRNSGMEPGEDIFTLGYPLINSMGTEVKLTTGIISSKTGYQGDISTYQVSAPVQPGNRGGPLFDRKGNLVGIINAKVNGAENASYAIKNNYLSSLIDVLPTKPIINPNPKLNDLPLQDQVKMLSKFVYIIEAEN